MHYDISKFRYINLVARSEVVVVGGNVIGIVFNPDSPSVLPSYRNLKQKVPIYFDWFRVVYLMCDAPFGDPFEQPPDWYGGNEHAEHGEGHLPENIDKKIVF